MKKLNSKLIAGIVTTIIIYVIFFGYQVSFAQRYENTKEIRVDSINRQALLKLNNEVIQTLNLRVDAMEKYVDAGQRNLDLWLKLLTFILSVLIGFSVYSGLKARELAKEELVEIRKIKESITREANDAEDRLKIVKDKILIIENSVINTKKIEEEATQMLDGLANKENLVLDEAQKKTMDNTIAKIKDELEKSGLDSLKNLYLAKALKAFSIKNWEEVIRLMSCYIDLKDTNENAIFKRAFAYFELASNSRREQKTILTNKAISDYSEVIRLDPNNSSAHNNLALAYRKNSQIELALKEYDEAIRLNPNRPRYYYNRSYVYDDLDRISEAEQDRIKAKELEELKAKAT